MNLWLLNFKCKKYINYRNFRNIIYFVNYFKEVNCNISFELLIIVMRCSDVCDVNILICNVIGIWLIFDKDVFNVCEELDVFIFLLV